MKKILLTGASSYSQKQIEDIEELGYQCCYMKDEAGKLNSTFFSVEAIVCNGLFLYHDLSVFPQLKFIQLTSAGLDRVPIERIRERGIVLKNARGVYSKPMAEWAIMQVLEHYKRASFFAKHQKEKKWEKERTLREVVGTQVAIIGAGSVGEEVAKRFKAFEAKVVGFDPIVTTSLWFDDIRDVKELPQQISNFDIVVLTAPLTADTHHLMSYPLLLSMKSNTILVNIARGALIDTDALIKVLKERSDLYAALDVFEEEPLPVNSPLWSLPNVSVSPHNSFISDGNNERIFKVIYQNLKDFIAQNK